MKANLKILPLIVLSLVFAGTLRAQFTFTTNNNALTVTFYNGPAGLVVIPDSTNGYLVTGIGSIAFAPGGPTTVVVPDSVTTIAGNAFYTCPTLTNVVIGSGANSIADSAFYHCANLLALDVNSTNTTYSSVDGVLYDKNQTSLIQYPNARTGDFAIPSTVEKIGGGAFDGCALSSLEIPAGVTNIPTAAFAGSYSLTNINADSANPFFFSTNGVLFNKTQTTLLTYPAGITGSYTIPAGVTAIGTNAFQNNTNLPEIVVPATVKTIGDEGFYGCRGMTNISLPFGLTNIGTYAFSYCTSLPDVALPGSITTLGTGVFSLCTNLGNVTFSNGIVNTGTNTFANCSSVTNVALPNSITNIGDFSFYYCTNLPDITLPASVKAIGASAFRGCNALPTFDFPTNLTSIGSSAFFACQGLTNIIIPGKVGAIGANAFGSCSRLTTVWIGSGVTNIGGAAFMFCTNLASLSISSSVTNLVIGNTAFGACRALTNVVFPGGVSRFGSYAFENCPDLLTAYFKGQPPVGDTTVFAGETSTVYYLPNLTGWTTTYAGQTTALWKPVIATDGASSDERTNGITFNIVWTSGETVVVETATNLADPLWQAIQTNSLATDSITFSDPQWTNSPNRFYRLRSP